MYRLRQTDIVGGVALGYGAAPAPLLVPTQRCLESLVVTIVNLIGGLEALQGTRGAEIQGDVVQGVPCSQWNRA